MANNFTDKSQWVSVKNAAQEMGVDRATIRRWCVKGDIECYKIENVAWLVNMESLRHETNEE